MKNLAMKVVSNCMRKEAKKELIKLNKNPNNIFTLIKFMKKDGKDIEGDRCIRGKGRRLGFSENDRKRIWKNQKKEIMNKENNWDHMTGASMVEVPFTCKEMVTVIKAMKPGKSAGPVEVCVQMISASGEVGISVTMELCQCILVG